MSEITSSSRLREDPREDSQEAAAEAAGAAEAALAEAVSPAEVPAAAEAAAGKTMKKKYIIFDFDGTLCNTNNIIIDSWQAVFEHYLGRRLPQREIEATFGEVLAHTISEKLPDAPLQAVVDYYRAFQNEHQEGKVYVFDGIRKLLAELRERGYIIGVGTSRTTYSFWNYMKQFGLESSVDEVVTMNDVKSHKPDPETIYALLARMAGSECTGEGAASEDPGQYSIPEEVLQAAIMIGDTKYDVGCANNAGVDSVLVGWSHYVDEEDMSACGFEPTYFISSPEELLEIV